MKNLYAFFYFKNSVALNTGCLFTRLGGTYNALLTDRFNFLNKYSQWNVATFDDPLPKINPKLNYKEICLNRGKELAEQYPDGIALAYSGGVDSLGMVAILIQAGYPLDKIHIVGNEFSIKECPESFEYFKRKNIKVTIGKKDINFSSHFDTVPEKVIIDGHCNDQFFHVGTVYEYVDKELLPIEDGLRWLYKRTYLERYLESDLDILLQYSKLVGWEVKDLFDLSVLINFGCRYKFVKAQLPMHCLNVETANKFINFYDNQDFQDWALTNREVNKENYKLCLNNKRYYKKELKDIIYEVFKYDEYLNTKGKEGSWGKAPVRLFKEDNKRPFILSVWDEDGYHVKFYNPKLSEPKYLKRRQELFNEFFAEYLNVNNNSQEYNIII